MRVCLITLGDPRRVTGGYLYHRRLADRAAGHDAEVEFVSFPRAPWPLPAAAGPWVWARAQSQTPDVVVLDSIAAAFAAPWLWRWKLPLAAIVHQPPGGIGNSRSRSKLQTALDMSVYRRAARIMAASDSLGEDLSGRGIPDRKIRVVPPGKDVTRSEVGTVPELRAGRKAALLCVANWNPPKGITELLEAVARLPRGVATLHLVGDNQANARYALRVRRLLDDPRLRERVVVHGPVSSHEVARLYAAADIFVLPSTKEAYGTVYGEAMAAGLPVVGWDVGNLPHLASDGVEGFVVPTGDIAALATVLRRIAEDEDMRAGMASAARDRALGFPTWDDTAQAFFAGLRELLNEFTKK